MYRIPSRRARKKGVERPNLIPILDAVFIFIFFLLMSASFLKIYEINSDVPIVSSAPPPKDQKKPLALTLKILPQSMQLYTGVPSQLVKTFGKVSAKEYDIAGLHSYLVGLKKDHVKEESIVFEPVADIEYQILVDIMDAVRTLDNTDPAYYVRDKDGVDVRIKTLFSNIIFGNIRS